MKRITIFTLFSLFTAVWCFAQTDLQPAAIVNLTKSEPITVKQLRTEVERIEKAPGAHVLSKEERLQVLDVMINEKLVMQAAERDKITISDNEVNQHMNQLRAQLAQNLGRQPTDAEFATAVKNEFGLDVAAYREQMRRTLLTQKYLMSKKQSSFEAIKPPTDTDITSFYNLNKFQFVRPDTVRFSMIQIDYGQDRAKAKELADKLIKEIGSNASKFDEVVLKGQVPNSGYQAGEAGYLSRSMEAAQVVGQDFITTAFNLKQGEVSKLMEGKVGYQIIKITETYSQKNLELDDIYKLEDPRRLTVRNNIINYLMQRQQMEVLKKASEELVAELRANGKTYQIFQNNVSW